MLAGPFQGSWSFSPTDVPKMMSTKFPRRCRWTVSVYIADWGCQTTRHSCINSFRLWVGETGNTTSMTLYQSLFKTPCKFIGHLGGGTRNMPEGGICHVLWLTGQRRRCHMRQENTKSSNILNFYLGCHWNIAVLLLRYTIRPFVVPDRAWRCEFVDHDQILL